MPQPLQVDSRKGDAAASRPGPGGMGRETVTARPNAYARADNVANELVLPGALVMRGPRTISEVQLEPGRSRRAEATALLGELSIAGDLVRLTGMEWRSEHRTGERNGTTGSFRMGGITLAGQALPNETPEQMRTSIETVNGVLGPLGLRLELPVVRRTDDRMWMEVTPLTLVVGEGTTLGPIIAPLLPLTQPARDLLIEELASCEGPLGSFSRLIAGGVTVADVSLGAFSGTGGIDFEFGGTRASTEGVAYDSPFEEVGSLPPVEAPPIVAAADDATESRTVPGERVAGRTSAIGRAASRSTRCESSHPNVNAGCSDGRGVLAGAIAVLVTGALVGGEVWRVRRRSSAVV
jgi:hypothetical protein